MPSDLLRCPWVTPGDTLYERYHDKEWGVPVRSDKKIYEFLVLESFQAGLSWRTILHRRKNFAQAFHHFDYTKIAQYTDKDITRLMNDAGIIRNKLKILAAINNAKRFIEIRKEFGTFSKYMWSWVGDKPIKNRIEAKTDYKPYIDEALAWAKDLKKRGFKFLGPTVIYAHMQATGMVNDHLTSCFRYPKV